MVITRGRVLAQRFFDIAEAIDLQQASALMTELSRRPRFAGSARHIQLPNPPLEMPLGVRAAGFAGVANAEVVVRLYDIGALVITFVIDLPNPTEPEALIRLAQRLAEDDALVTRAAKPMVDEVAKAIAQACKAGFVATDLTEDYTIFYIQNTVPECDGDTLGNDLDIPRLLLGETEPIAQREREQLMHAPFSYRPDDLVVVGWNSAVVLDPSGAVDVPELLELASMQMLELRTYDSLVGRALDGLYNDLDEGHRGASRSSRFSTLSRRIMRLFVDVTEMSERIDNSLTFLGDTWLARVHRTAVAEFGIPHWQRQLRNKLEVLRQINELLVDQITSQKSLNIEIAIVGLIIIEILMALLRML